MMNRILVILAIVMTGCLQQPDVDSEELQNNVESYLSQQEGTFSVWFESLDDPELKFSINQDTLFHAASTMKTPVMIELFKRADAGEFSMQDSIVIKNEFTSIVDSSTFSLELDPNADDPFEAMVGQKATIYDLTHAMITYSSNLATNLMIELVGAEATTQTMRDLGAERIEVLRGVEDLKAFDRGLSNRTTSRDLGAILKAIAKGEAVSTDADSSMIEILKDQFYKDVIPSTLPSDVVVANKTGWITGVRHDSAIVYLPDGRSYILVFLSKNLGENDETGVEIGATVSEMIYEALTN